MDSSDLNPLGRARPASYLCNCAGGDGDSSSVTSGFAPLPPDVSANFPSASRSLELPPSFHVKRTNGSGILSVSSGGACPRLPRFSSSYRAP